MSSISGVSSSGSNWAQLKSAHAANQSKMQEWLLKEADADGNGSIDTSELQTVLDDVSKKTGVTSTTSASDLLAKADADGSGSLSASELGQAMQSVLPSPPSTMDFAQGRGGDAGATGQAGDDLFAKVDADGSGGIDASELATLMAKMKSGGDANATDSTDASNELFAKLDTNGDGSLSETEFDAGRPGASQGDTTASAAQAGGMPPGPPPAGGPGGAGGAGGSSDSTTYDPLDTNQDGVVSAAELAAGIASGTATAADAVKALFAAVDTDGDHKLSTEETDTFAKQVATALQSMQSGTSSTSSSSDSSTSSASSESKPFDLQTLAQLVLKQYEAIAKNQSSTASTGTLVDASA